MTRQINDPHAPASPEEKRALDADEQELADEARNPTLAGLSDGALSDLVSRLRSRRNRARDISDRQGREARAKAAPSGASAAKGNEGTLSKLDYLNAALERATEAREARGNADGADSQDGAPTQKELAEKALALKTENTSGPNAMTEEGGPLHPNDPDASHGKAGLAETERKKAPSGALDHAGELPSRERSRTRY